MKKVLTAIFAFLFLFSAVGGAAAYVNAEEDTELAKTAKPRIYATGTAEPVFIPKTKRSIFPLRACVRS